MRPLFGFLHKVDWAIEKGGNNDITSTKVEELHVMGHFSKLCMLLNVLYACYQIPNQISQTPQGHHNKQMRWENNKHKKNTKNYMSRLTKFDFHLRGNKRKIHYEEKYYKRGYLYSAAIQTSIRIAL